MAFQERNHHHFRRWPGNHRTIIWRDGGNQNLGDCLPQKALSSLLAKPLLIALLSANIALLPTPFPEHRPAFAATEPTAALSIFAEPTLSDIGKAERSALTRAFTAIEEGEYDVAESLLTSCIGTWERTKQPVDEVAVLYAKRAGVRDTLLLQGSSTKRQQQEDTGLRSKVLPDYNEAVRLLLIDDALPYNEPPVGAREAEKKDSDEDDDDTTTTITATTTTTIDSGGGGILSGGPQADPAALPRALLARADVHRRLNDWQSVDADLSAVDRFSGRLPPIQQTNPYLYEARAQARARLGRWEDAAEDALAAESEFQTIGDRIRKTISAGDAALFLYGSGDSKGSVAKMVQVFKEKGQPTTNNPDDIPLLQELSRTDAELHLAYAADLYANGQKTRASAQWESGCIRIEAFVQDGLARQADEERKNFEDGELPPDQPGNDNQAVLDSLKKPITLDSLAETSKKLNALSVGLAADSPYVTQRPGRQYYYYKLGDGKERRTEAVKLQRVDEKLSCNRFREEEWVTANRPNWPPLLKESLATYVSEVPASPIKMPAKGGPLSEGEQEFASPALQSAWRQARREN